MMASEQLFMSFWVSQVLELHKEYKVQTNIHKIQLNGMSGPGSKNAMFLFLLKSQEPGSLW